MKMEERVSPWLTPALMTERISWAESIGVYSGTFASWFCDQRRGRCLALLQKRGISIPARICSEPGEGETFTAVTSKPRRALERTHYRVSGISVSSVYRIARIAMIA
jgi:hypothetical protein